VQPSFYPGGRFRRRSDALVVGVFDDITGRVPDHEGRGDVVLGRKRRNIAVEHDLAIVSVPRLVAERRDVDDVPRRFDGP